MPKCITLRGKEKCIYLFSDFKGGCEKLVKTSFVLPTPRNEISYQVLRKGKRKEKKKKILV